MDKNGDEDAGTKVSSSEPKGQELIYSAHISLDRSTADTEDRGADLAATVAIRTSSRRIVYHLLSPLLRYRQESLRQW